MRSTPQTRVGGGYLHQHGSRGYDAGLSHQAPRTIHDRPAIRGIKPQRTPTASPIGQGAGLPTTTALAYGRKGRALGHLIAAVGDTHRTGTPDQARGGNRV